MGQSNCMPKSTAALSENETLASHADQACHPSAATAGQVDVEGSSARVGHWLKVK